MLDRLTPGVIGFFMGTALGILLMKFFAPMPLCESKYAHVTKTATCQRIDANRLH